jgi:UDP-N-acetylglucosamine--N-acetylmuramyl-(pentapeptide) pyrophosphoryl-undecaprenol N-acetylglucosamine transferase
MGGFTSTAPILAGRLKLPTLIHESNAIPGRANKFTARFVTRAARFPSLRPLFQTLDWRRHGHSVRRNLGSPLSRATALAAFRLEENRRSLLVMEEARAPQASTKRSLSRRPSSRTSGSKSFTLTGDRDDRLAAANYQRENIPHYVAPFHHRMEEAHWRRTL